MKKYYQGLIDGHNFNEQDAKEITDIIIKEEGVENTDSYNFSESYTLHGARWDREEIVQYMNAGLEDKLDIEDILNFDYVYELTSGLIITWRY